MKPSYTTLRKIFKNLITPIWGFPVLWFSYLIPRNKDKWIFGSDFGFADNPKYLSLEASKGNIRSIWIIKDKDKFKKVRHIVPDIYYIRSIHGIYHLLTSGVYLTSHDLHRSLSVWTTGRASWVNLWHGVGIKTVKFKTKTSFFYRVNSHPLLKIATYPLLYHLHKKPDLVLATSPLMTQHFKECFLVDDSKMISAGYPRNYPFFMNENNRYDLISIYSNAYQVEITKKIKKFKKVYMYMPTWRSDGEKLAVGNILDLGRLNKLCYEEDSVFIIKSHRNSSLSIEGNAYDNIINLSKDIDVYLLLPYVNVLITDYSSVYYDFILMKDKNILLYPYDYDDYMVNSRDLAFDFDEYTPGKRVYDFEQLINALKNKTFTSTSSEEIEDIRKTFWDYEVQSNQELVDHIKARI